jgi:adenylate kinase
MLHVIFYGPEGSGKTTQGKLLSEKLDLPQLVSGDIVRKYAKEDQGIMGEVCRNALDKGHYVADSEMFVLWKQRLKEPDCADGWIIDGFPRNLDQARFLEDKLDKYGQEIDVVFYLDVSTEESIRRLTKRGRKSPDGTLHDSPDKIRERLRRYKAAEKDVLEFYKEKGVLEVVDGEKSIEEIHSKILEIVAEINGDN